MAKVLINDTTLQNMANTIRSKKNTQETYTPSEMVTAVGTLTQLNNQSKSVTPSTSSQLIQADSGYTGLSSVNVNAVTSSIDNNITAHNIKNGVTILGVEGDYQGTAPTGTISITTNGTHDVTNYATADVEVPSTGTQDVEFGEYVTSGSSSYGPGVSRSITRINDMPLSASTNLTYMFYGMGNLEYLDANMFAPCNPFSMAYCFYGCAKLETIPYINTSTTTSFDNAFRNCSKVTSFPILNLSSATNLGNMFYYFASNGTTSSSNTDITDDVAYNIIESLKTATNYTGNKKLSTLGMSATKIVNRMTSQSNWQDLVDDGWTVS